MIQCPKDLFAHVVGRLRIFPKIRQFGNDTTGKWVDYEAIVDVGGQSWERVRNLRSSARPLGRRLAWDYLETQDSAVAIDDTAVSGVKWVHQDGSPYDVRPLERSMASEVIGEAYNLELSRHWGEKVGAWPKQCWFNCVKVLRRISKKDGDFFYVEGFARRKEDGIVVEHGWIESADGEIIDPTILRDDMEYFPGVRYTRSQVMGFGKKQPPYVWGGKHGFGGFGHPEYKKAHDTAWSFLMNKGKVSEAKGVIDQIVETPYYDINPSEQTRQWAAQNKVDVVRSKKTKIITINYDNAPELFRDVKWTNAERYDDHENMLAFLNTRMPGEDFIQIRVRTFSGRLGGLYHVLATPAQLQQMMRKSVDAAMEQPEPEDDNDEPPNLHGPMGANEAILLEMPQVVAGRVPKPKVTKENFYVDVYNGTGIVARVKAVLPDGTHRIFTATKPFSPEVMAELRELCARNPRPYVSIDEIGKEVLAKDDPIPELYRQAGREAWEWVSQHQDDSDFVRVKRTKVINVKCSVGPLVKEMRYAKVGRASERSTESIVGLMSMKKPEDKLVKLRGSDSTSGGTRFDYYVLLSPEEERTLSRRIIMANRQRVANVMDEN